MKVMTPVGLAVFLMFTLSLSPIKGLADTSKIEQVLLSKISAAQSDLSTTELKIAKERSKLTQLMTDIEHQLVALEKKAVTARKIADEKNLNLSQLENRLKKWQNQQSYQQNLLLQFLRPHASSIALDAPVQQKLAFVTDISDKVELWFEPAFAASQLVVESGKIIDTERISYGPIHWMVDKETAYRTEKVEDEWIVQQVLSDEEHSALLSLKQGKSVQLSFDPSLSKLAQVLQESIIEHVHKGGIWIAPILSFALVALVIAIIRGVALWRLPKVQQFSLSTVTNMVQGQTQPPEMGDMQSTLLKTTMFAQSEHDRDDLLFQQLQQDKVTLEKRLTAIAVTASVAPLLGLLGTVSGMIETFRMITLFGSGDPEVVSGGIAQALITTEMGLVVAIPALIIHAILSRSAKAYHSQLENFALMLSQIEMLTNQKEAA